MRGHLVSLWLAHARGDPAVLPPRPVVPPHHAGRCWTFRCTCGASWVADHDAVWRDGDWRAPECHCPTCHRFVEGQAHDT